MASWGDVYRGLRGQIVTALTGYVQPQNVTIGYPATFIAQTSGQPGDIGALAQNVSRSPLVMIYDRGMAKDVTRWIPRRMTNWVATAPTLQASLDEDYLAPGGTVYLSVTSGAAANDAIGLSLATGTQTVGAVFTASGATTASGVASGLASEIDALGLPVTTLASGGTIEISNVGDAGYGLSLAIANVSTSLYEVHRVKRSTQVIVLANRPETLDTVSDQLSQLFGELEVTYGYDLSDGTYVRLINTGDIMLWDNVLSNIARRDFVLTLEYGVNLQSTGYEVLASQLQFDNGFVLDENLQ